jgi:hypothetical protein
MINYNKKYIFVRIPKTASTSIGKVLSTMWMTHTKLSELKKMRDHHQYFIFCFVRNPWDRIYSAFEYLKQGGNSKSPWDIQAKLKMIDVVDGNFEEFIYKFVNKENSDFCNHVHFKLQLDWIGNSDYIDYIGKYENLNEDWKKISIIIGETKILPKENISKNRKPYRNVYNDKMVELVYDFYKKDILEFNYEF